MANVTIKDYQDWVKNNNKVKVPREGEKLSSYDELSNRTLYDQYVKEAEALSARREAENALQKQTETALRDNYIAQAQAEKKAQEAMKMQGITTGLSESSLIDLYARGAAARAGIISAADDEKRDILSKYRDAVATARSTANSSLAQIETGKDAYEKQNAVDQFNAALTGYEGGKIDFEDLKAAHEKFGASLDEEENYDLIQKYKNYADAYDKATIDVNREGFDVSDFGRFYGMGREDSAQHDYLEQVAADAKAGKIKEGQYIVPNFGKHLDKHSYVYQYLGNGRFKRVDREKVDKENGISLGKGRNGKLADLDVYTPEGYEYKNNAWQRFWGTTKVKKTGETEQEKAQKEEIEAWMKEHPEQVENLINGLLNPTGQKYKDPLVQKYKDLLELIKTNQTTFGE